MREIYVSERRLVNRMINYWEKLKTVNNNNTPNFKQFNGSYIQEILQNCFIVSVETNNTTKLYRCEFVGEEVKRAYGKNPMGELMSSHMNKLVPSSTFVEKMNKSTESLEPVIEQGRFINDQNQMVKYRSCVLPFSNKENNMSHIVVGFSWRIF